MTPVTKYTQETFGSPPPNVRTKSALKSHGITFRAPDAVTPDEIIRAAEEHGRTNFYALSSGGKDSQTVADYLAEHDKLTAVIHIQTNIGFGATTDFVRDYCQSRGWKLHIIQPRPPHIYAAFVLSYGFPGPSVHKTIMGRLKLKTMRDFILSLDRDKHCLASGVRRFESSRRMGNYQSGLVNDGHMWSCHSFFNYSNEEIYREYMSRGLPISPMYKTGLGMSGECMCGSFAAKDEKRIIQEHDPKLAEYIKWLEEGVRKFGTSDAKKFPRWGRGSMTKMSDIENQKALDEFVIDHPELAHVSEMESLICGNECGPGSMRGMMDI